MQGKTRTGTQNGAKQAKTRAGTQNSAKIDAGTQNDACNANEGAMTAVQCLDGLILRI